MIKDAILQEAEQLLASSIKNKESLKYQYQSEGDEHADIIFHNGKIISMAYETASEEKNIQYVAIKNGYIVDVGLQGSFEKWVGVKTKVIDLMKKTLLPGFIDPHIHFVYAGLGHWINLSPFVQESMETVKKTILEAIENVKEGQWVMCYGYDTIITPGQKLDLSIKTLDQMSSTIPIFIMQSNGHIAYANSMAFLKSGVTAETPDPPHSRFVRDAQGNLTGVIEEVPAINIIQYHSPPLTAAQYIYYTKQFFEHASSKGCTSLHDCGIGAYNAKLDYKIIHTVMNSDPCVRFSGFLVGHAAKYWETLSLSPEKNDPFFRINGMKFWVDGSLQAGSGYLKDSYCCGFDGRGQPNYPQQMLNNVVLKAHSEGWQIGIHGNGDAAIDMALQAYEIAQQKHYQKDIRHRIEHCTVCREDQFDRMKKLEVSPSFLIGHVYYYGQFFKDNILGERKIDSTRTALKKGLKISLHSDYLSQPIDPLRCVSNAVTRKSYTSGQIINEEERLTPYQALKGMTIDAAWQCHSQKIVGSIEIGKCADFVVLDANPLEVDPEEIMKIQVLETWLSGRKRFSI